MLGALFRVHLGELFRFAAGFLPCRFDALFSIFIRAAETAGDYCIDFRLRIFALRRGFGFRRGFLLRGFGLRFFREKLKVHFEKVVIIHNYLLRLTPVGESVDNPRRCGGR